VSCLPTEVAAERPRRRPRWRQPWPRLRCQNRPSLVPFPPRRRAGASTVTWPRLSWPRYRISPRLLLLRSTASARLIAGRGHPSRLRRRPAWEGEISRGNQRILTEMPMLWLWSLVFGPSAVGGDGGGGRAEAEASKERGRGKGKKSSRLAQFL
jgi:hypothetical protein